MFGLFIIEAGQEPVALCGHYDNKPLIFPDGASAAEAATRAAAGDLPISGHCYVAIKVQPRRIASDAWKSREAGRFTDGSYVPLPWADLPALSLTVDHFAHVSTEDGSKIAYTQDAAKGMGDIQTRVKPGKYLTQFYGDIFDAPTIAKMSAEFSLQYGESLKLEFADTQDEIERVYVNGPRSCMAYEASHFSSSMHPCRIYAAGDLAVAYMVRNGDITARVLCWPAKKVFGRIYGDETRISELLEDEGFVPGDLDGARMLRIEERNGFICPYIDGEQEAKDDGTNLIIGRGRVCGGNQNGLSVPGYICEACGEDLDEDDCRQDGDGNYYCGCCFDDRFDYCERTGTTCDREGMQEVHTTSYRGRRGTQSWSENAVDNDATYCDATRKYYDNDLIVTLADGTSWNVDYFEDNGFTCDGTSECYSNADLVTLEDGTSWSKDYFDDHGVTVDGRHYAKGDEPEADEDDVPVVTAVDEVAA